MNITAHPLHGASAGAPLALTSFIHSDLFHQTPQHFLHSYTHSYTQCPTLTKPLAPLLWSTVELLLPAPSFITFACLLHLNTQVKV